MEYTDTHGNTYEVVRVGHPEAGDTYVGTFGQLITTNADFKREVRPIVKLTRRVREYAGD